MNDPGPRSLRRWDELPSKRAAVHDEDFLVLDSLLPARPVCVDVGANEGQSIASIKAMRPDAVIYAFEPNPGMAPILIETVSRFSGVTIFPYALGAADGEFILYVPSIHGICYHQEATINPVIFSLPWVRARWQARGGMPDLQEFSIPVRPGDSFGLAPHFIKIDVEGAELDVVRGFEVTLKTFKPVLLIENSDWSRVTSFLAAQGYQPMMPSRDFKRLVPLSGQRANTIYMPR